MFHLTALVTCLALLVYFLISFQVGKVRAASPGSSVASFTSPDIRKPRPSGERALPFRPAPPAFFGLAQLAQSYGASSIRDGHDSMRENRGSTSTKTKITLE